MSSSSAMVHKAETLRTLHHRQHNPLLLVNVWDAASTRVVAAHPATEAIASASWSVCAAAGIPDGGFLPLDQALNIARTIVASTDLPVTIDFEKGYATDLAGLHANVLRLIETGAVGLNVEDSQDDRESVYWSLEEQVERIRTIRQAANEAGIPLVINARTDVMVGGASVGEAIARGRAYLAAGADCIFVIGQQPEDIRHLVDAMGGPVSLLGSASSPSIPDLAAAGIARISLGPGSMGVAYAALRDLTSNLINRLPFPADLAFRPGT